VEEASSKVEMDRRWTMRAKSYEGELWKSELENVLLPM
jgi:hypothetical protein